MRLALIGGTGIDEMPCFREGAAKNISTRFGEVELIENEASNLIFVPRHGLDHSAPPSAINYRAQMAALRILEVEAVIGVCAVGSLRTDLPTGSFAILADFIDFTKQRISTFFTSDDHSIVHTDFTHPYCPCVSDVLRAACEDSGVQYEPAGVYLGVDGPRYETPAEVRLYASWGAQVVGMTNVPEVVLAREAGLCYGALAIVTNPASGLQADSLNHDFVRAQTAAVAEKLQAILTLALGNIPVHRECSCRLNSGLVI